MVKINKTITKKKGHPSLIVVHVIYSSLVYIVREPHSENCFYLIFAAPPCEKVIIIPDTNYVTSAIRKFMLDMPSPGSFQNV